MENLIKYGNNIEEGLNEAQSCINWNMAWVNLRHQIDLVNKLKLEF